MSSKVGLFRNTLFVTGTMTGVSLFKLPSLLFPFGVYSWCAWILCMVCVLFIGLMFGELSKNFAGGGGPYRFILSRYGASAGVCAGLAHLIVMTLQDAAIIDVMHSSLRGLCDPFTALILVYVPTLIFAVVNMRSFSFSSYLISIADVIKYIPVALLVSLGFFKIFAGELPVERIFYIPVGMTPLQGIASSAGLVVFAFSGIEYGVIASPEDIHNPNVTVPRSLILATLAATIIFMSVQAVVWAAADPSPTMIADAAGVILGPHGRALMSAVGLFFSYVSLNNSLVAAAHLAHAMRPGLSASSAATAALTIFLSGINLWSGGAALHLLIQISDLVLSCIFLVCSIVYAGTKGSKNWLVIASAVSSLTLLVVMTGAVLL